MGKWMNVLFKIDAALGLKLASPENASGMKARFSGQLSFCT
jgi:hypothetical protein